MPPAGKITSFFKPFAIPKNKFPVQRVIEEEIVVASSQRAGSGAASANGAATERKIDQKSQLSHDEQGVSHASGTDHGLEGRLRNLKYSNSPPTLQLLVELDSEFTSSLTQLESTQSTTENDDTAFLKQDVREPHLSTNNFLSSDVTTSKQSESRNGHLENATSSFASIASHSTTSSSRRILQGGVKAVTNSDSDSLSTSSDDGLADIADLVPRKRRRLTPLKEDKDGHVTPHPRTSERLSEHSRSESSRTRQRDRRRLPSPPPKPRYKHSLSSIVRQHEKFQASEARIKQAEQYVEEQQRQRDAQAEVDAQGTRRRLTLSTEMIGSDEENGERMKAAIKRIEALQPEDIFHYFHGESPLRPPDFPLEALPPHLEFLNDESQRQQAFISGFAADMARTVGLPDEVLLWVSLALRSEPSELLCIAYIGVIEAAPKDIISRLTLSSSSLREIYSGQTIFDLSHAKPQPPGANYVPMSLQHMLHLKSIAPGTNSIDDSASFLTDLVLLGIDEHIRASLDLQLDIEGAMQATLNIAERSDSVIQSAIKQLSGCGLLSKHSMCRAITSLSATTQSLHRFRRTLALHFLLKADVDETVDPNSPDTGTRLLVRLRHDPLFSVSDDCDWGLMLSIISVLEIAIDAGFSDFSFLQGDVEVESKPTTVFTQRASESRAEQAFNEQVDDLATRLRLMASNIRDAGTSHLRRTEAKTALDMLCTRLEYTVRTKPKPRKGVFGGLAGTAEESFLRGFLTKESSSDDETNEMASGDRKENDVAGKGLDNFRILSA